MVQQHKRTQSATHSAKKNHRVDTATSQIPLTIERTYCPNYERQLRALTIVLGLPFPRAPHATQSGAA